MSPPPTVEQQTQQISPINLETTRRSQRTSKPTDRYKEYQESLRQDNIALFTNFEETTAYATSSDPDTMYLDQALHEPDCKEFILAMIKEIADHVQCKHWKIVHISEVPKGTKILDSVWSMKRKRRILTREVYKWKACLTVHGGQQEYGINYWETYAPVVQWTSICSFLINALLNSWYQRQLDFILAYPQAPIECPL